ncbi:MAG: helical backbone metal receptor, partial [candidate division WOR-3 bacterium]
MKRVGTTAVVLLLCSCPGASHKTSTQRVVSLVPSVTEIIYALNAGQTLVGNTNQCDYPTEAQQMYKVGDFSAPDLERIVALKPSIVFATLPVHRALIEKLRELKIAVYVSQPTSIDDVFDEIHLVGRKLSVEAKADSLVLELQHRLDAVVKCPDTPGVYVEISASPL